MLIENEQTAEGSGGLNLLLVFSVSDIFNLQSPVNEKVRTEWKTRADIIAHQNHTGQYALYNPKECSLV